MKEQGIKNRLGQGYEQQLEFIKKSLTKPRGIKRVDKVQQRIGRAKEKYPSVHHLYNISFDIDEPSQTVLNIYWHKDVVKVAAANNKPGVYFFKNQFRKYRRSFGMDDLQHH